jgi:hypothetical protein
MLESRLRSGVPSLGVPAVLDGCDQRPGDPRLEAIEAIEVMVQSVMNGGKERIQKRCRYYKG